MVHALWIRTCSHEACFRRKCGKVDVVLKSDSIPSFDYFSHSLYRNLDVEADSINKMTTVYLNMSFQIGEQFN